MGIGKEIGKEWGAYRSVVEEEATYNNSVVFFPGRLSHRLERLLNRVCAEKSGLQIYLQARLRHGYSPEAISQKSECFIRKIERSAH